MIYATYSNEELRRVLLASPQDAAAVAEAAARFADDRCDKTEIEASEDHGYDRGCEVGYENGYADGLAEGQQLD